MHQQGGRSREDSETNPTVQVEMTRSSQEVSDSIQKQSGGFNLSNKRTDTGEQMPQEQFQRVKQKQNPSAESLEQDQGSTVTACTRNDAIRHQTHDAGKDLQRARHSQSSCCQDCQRSSQRSRRPWRCRRIVDARVLLSILEETVAVMKLVPHECAQTTQKTAGFPSRCSSTRLLTIA